MNSPSPLSQLLHKASNSSLNRILARAKGLQQLERRLLQCLDIEAATHCRLLNIEQGECVLGVDSAAWASRLRYQLPNLLECARRLEGLSGLRHIRLSLQEPTTPLTEASLPKRPAQRLSRESAMAVNECARHIEHEGLRHALQRLASRGKGSNEETED